MAGTDPFDLWRSQPLLLLPKLGGPASRAPAGFEVVREQAEVGHGVRVFAKRVLFGTSPTYWYEVWIAEQPEQAQEHMHRLLAYHRAQKWASRDAPMAGKWDDAHVLAGRVDGQETTWHFERHGKVLFKIAGSAVRTDDVLLHARSLALISLFVAKAEAGASNANQPSQIQKSTCRVCGDAIVLNERVSTRWLHTKPGRDHSADPSSPAASPARRDAGEPVGAGATGGWGTYRKSDQSECAPAHLPRATINRLAQENDVRAPAGKTPADVMREAFSEKGLTERGALAVRQTASRPLWRLRPEVSGLTPKVPRWKKAP